MKTIVGNSKTNTSMGILQFSMIIYKVEPCFELYLEVASDRKKNWSHENFELSKLFQIWYE